MLVAARAIGLTATSMFGTASLVLSPAAAPPAWIPFDEARIFVEYNASDGDAEVVVDVDADVGLERFLVLNPNGRTVLDLRSKHTDDLGIRKIALETPEPSLDDVLAAYPAGPYWFFGRSTDGQILFSSVTLSHSLPQAPVITFPLDGATGVPTSGGAVGWTAGPDADSFFFELESDDAGVDLKANLAGGAASFGFPAGFLVRNTEFQVGVGARSENGNLTVVEHTFHTAP